MKKKHPELETVATNRKARHDYEILETLEAGLVLEGPEVKSLRMKQAQIAQSFARAEKDGLYLYGMHIPPYAFNTMKELDPVRTRKLLLNKKEIKKLSNSIATKGTAIVPLEVYFKNGWAKVLLALARGKKAPDKHEAKKKKELDRELRRDFKEKFKG
ncbi:MAG: SsrA-binding protein [Elusimicrobia bacterium RIFOXYA12_FULL_51_18]|nr:MAG: SsrA-binding protein [Elusimicrobia bacterium RIFOXYA12_FULL_51_18]OGS31283.1 MAG: SsrA-binding protein [Elusimicrobia bacterium RIFOXYA2_FULL_53_38]